MLPSIGIMIGFYIVTRMLSFLGRSGERSELLLVKVFAAITIVVTMWVMYDLLIRGVSNSGIQ